MTTDVERRLQAAFTALADTIADPADPVTTPADAVTTPADPVGTPWDNGTGGRRPTHPAGPPGSAPANNRTNRTNRALTAAAAGAVLVVGAAVFALRPDPTASPAAEHTTTGHTTGEHTTAGHTTAAPTTAAPTTTPPPTAPAGRAIPYRLYTHCGIDEAKVGDTFYEAVTPLHDGAHSPPPGWDNPYQDGTMTLIGDTEAVFTDTKGHEVRFRVRPGATDFKRLCR